MPSILRLSRFAGLLGLLIAFGHVSLETAQAQPKAVAGYPTPQLTVLGPFGGKAGSTVELSLTGQNLARPQGILLDGQPLTVEWIAAPMPEPKKGMQPPPPQQKGNQTLLAKVTLPSKMTVGLHDLRFVGHWGVSNPRLFAVGDQTEVQEKEGNNDIDQAQEVPLGCSINGVIAAPTDVDFYRFEGKKGQRVLLTCLSTSIDSRLTPSIQLYTQSGSPLGFNRDYRGNDAVLDATLPADGSYLVRVFAFTYTAGSSEHFYRLNISTAPWIDTVFPPVVEPGKKSRVTLYGRNLPGGKLDPTAKIDGRPLEVLSLDVEAPRDSQATQRLDLAEMVPPHQAAVDGFPVQVKNPGGASNSFLLQYATAPVVLEKDENDKPEQAQEVSVPCEIAGRLEKIRDRDWYRFSAKKGETLSIEISGDRLGSPVDMFAVLRSAEGKVIAEMDDNPDLLHPLTLYSRTEDPSRYRFVVPADGAYQLLISSRDADIQAGPRSIYRVRIAPERPDFRLILQSLVANSPEDPALRAGAAAAFNAFVVAQDGFSAPITLEAEGLPAGVQLATTNIPAGAKTTTVAFTAPADAKEWAGTFTLRARATVAGKELVREARMATIVWAVPVNQNIPTLSRLTRDCVLSVRPAPPFKVDVNSRRIVLQPGESAELPVKVVALDKEFSGAISVGPFAPVSNPQNAPFVFNNNGEIALQPGAEGKPKVQAGTNATPGLYTLQLRGQATVSLVLNPDTGEKGRGPIQIPAVPVQVLVLPKTLVTAKVTGGENVKLKIGEKLDLPLKVERSPFFSGPLDVEVVIPPAEARGLTGSRTKIDTAKDEAVISLQAPAGSTIGPRQGVLIRLSGETEGRKFNQDVKLSVTLSK